MKKPTHTPNEVLQNAADNHNFIGATLSKPTKNSTLKNVFIKVINAKKSAVWSFTLRYPTHDQTQNYTPNDGIIAIIKYIETDFLIANIFCKEADYQFITNKNNTTHAIKTKPTQQQTTAPHDRQKNYIVPPTAAYLHLLGIANASGQILKDKHDKYRQINKYIEIMAGLIQNTPLASRPFSLADMGSGKGYLTFALYDYFYNTLGLQVQITGVEMRKNLVDLCNEIAQKLGFIHLKFVVNTVQDFNEKPDVLVALHACDTATDDAIYAGITTHATLIVCAPCCHKQVRQAMPPTAANLHPMLRHGIIHERQAEILTDTIRALILEKNGYKTNIFEFIQTEHTAKNLLITAQKTNHKNPEASTQIQHLKNTFGIQTHYLETLINTAK